MGAIIIIGVLGLFDLSIAKELFRVSATRGSNAACAPPIGRKSTDCGIALASS